MYRIRPPHPHERQALLTVWRRSVEASHTFLSRRDIDFYQPMVREFLESDVTILALCGAGSSGPLGFMALDQTLDAEDADAKIEALFIDPAHFRKGFGSLLVRCAQSRHNRLTLDVNEDNPDARVFYERMGFRKTGRSELDGAGRPFPLIHMLWEKS